MKSQIAAIQIESLMVKSNPVRRFNRIGILPITASDYGSDNILIGKPIIYIVIEGTEVPRLYDTLLNLGFMVSE